jgi:hypothetical protein
LDTLNPTNQDFARVNYSGCIKQDRWTRLMCPTDARIVLLYGYVGPMWLQTFSEATANVRIIGPSTMIWQDVRYKMGELAPGADLEIALKLDPTK